MLYVLGTDGQERPQVHPCVGQNNLQALPLARRHYRSGQRLQARAQSLPRTGHWRRRQRDKTGVESILEFGGHLLSLQGREGRCELRRYLVPGGPMNGLQVID